MAGRGLLALLAVIAGGCGSPAPQPVPDAPSFATDVLPITLAHCVKCHGAGGTLNVVPGNSLQYPPPDGFFDHYEDQGDCTGDAGPVQPPVCKRGAAYLAPSIEVYVMEGIMPPPPEQITDRQTTILLRWAAETPPKP